MTNMPWQETSYDDRCWTIYCTVRALQPQARVATIYKLLNEQHKANSSIGSIYSTLELFETTGYLRSELQSVTTRRPNRNTRLWFVTGKPHPADVSRPSGLWLAGDRQTV